MFRENVICFKLRQKPKSKQLIAPNHDDETQKKKKNTIVKSMQCIGLLAFTNIINIFNHILCHCLIKR